MGHLMKPISDIPNSSLVDATSTAGPDEAAVVATPPGRNNAGARLDEDHLPETNGRMAICRRCGAQTDGPQGRHAPMEKQVGKATEWLDLQKRKSHIAHLKNGRDT